MLKNKTAVATDLSLFFLALFLKPVASEAGIFDACALDLQRKTKVRKGIFASERCHMNQSSTHQRQDASRLRLLALAVRVRVLLLHPPVSPQIQVHAQRIICAHTVVIFENQHSHTISFAWECQCTATVLHARMSVSKTALTYFLTPCKAVRSTNNMHSTITYLFSSRDSASSTLCSISCEKSRHVSNSDLQHTTSNHRVK
jgi:hypothetical protein